MFDRAFQLTRAALTPSGESRARQAASALYHVTTAAALTWEAAHTDLSHRAALARLVVRHRLLPRDPLIDDLNDPDCEAVIEATSKAIVAAG